LAGILNNKISKRMNQEQFKILLEEATKFLIKFTQEYCFNHFPNYFRFKVTPNTRTPDKHLDATEITVLEGLNRVEGKILTADQVVELLCIEGKVPVYINLSVYEATDKHTIIDLYTSRRLRKPEEVENRTDKYPPFHPVVPVPPDHLKIEKDGKYDINWKKRLDEKQRPKGLLEKIKNLLVN
jgi:hypothetical protein